MGHYVETTQGNIKCARAQLWATWVCTADMFAERHPETDDEAVKLGTPPTRPNVGNQLRPPKSDHCNREGPWAPVSGETGKLHSRENGRAHTPPERTPREKQIPAQRRADKHRPHTRRGTGPSKSNGRHTQEHVASQQARHEENRGRTQAKTARPRNEGQKANLRDGEDREQNPDERQRATQHKHDREAQPRGDHI